MSGGTGTFRDEQCLAFVTKAFEINYFDKEQLRCVFFSLLVGGT